MTSPSELESTLNEKTPQDFTRWPMTGVRRFDQKIHVAESGCWLWTGKDDGRDGYGRAWFHGKWRSAHRVIYEVTRGPIPDGLTIDHLCRARACVNPEHLEPVTVRVNTLRGFGPSAGNARKDTCSKGHPFDSLNEKGRRRCSRCYKQRLSEWGINKRNAQLCGAPTDRGTCRRTIAVGKSCPNHYRVNIDGRVFDLTKQ